MNRKKRIRRKLTALGGTFLLAVLIGLLLPPDNGGELKLRDLRFRIRGEKQPEAPLIIAAVDDTSFELLNSRWPWRRSLFAAAVENLTADGAALIGFDIMLSEKDYNPPDDLLLADAFSDHGAVIVPLKIEGASVRQGVSVYAESPLPVYLDSAAGTGVVNLVRDRDDRIRSFPYTLSVDGGEYPSFALAVLDLYAKLKGMQMPASGLRDGSFDRPVLIDYAGGAGTFPIISLSDVIEGNFPPGLFTDKIVLVGAAFAESHDNYRTPFTGGEGKRMYGVEIHGHGINTLFSGTFPKPLSPGPSFAVILFVLCLTLYAGFFLKPSVGLTGALGLMACYFIAAVAVFNRVGIFLPLFRPLVLVVFAYLGSVVYRYFGEFREKKAVQSIFSRYVSPKVVEKVLKSEETLRLGGEVRRVALFFSDIRGFTGMSENLSPPDIVRLLNRYFTRMGEIIYDYEGTLNKFIGDAIMAFYGAPVPQEDSPKRAVFAALEMREALADLNEQFRREGLPEISIGMGMHLGEVLVGNIGSTRQMEYTVIGDAVNVCSRIETLTKEFGHDILISDELYRQVRDEVTVQTPEAVPVKGKSSLIQVHKVIGRK